MSRDVGSLQEPDAAGPREGGAEDAGTVTDADTETPADTDAAPDADAHSCPSVDVDHWGDGGWTKVGSSGPLREGDAVVGINHYVRGGGGRSYRTREFTVDSRCPVTVHLSVREVQQSRGGTVHLLSVRWPGSDGQGVTVGLTPQGRLEMWSDDCFFHDCTSAGDSLNVYPNVPFEVRLDMSPTQARVVLDAQSSSPVERIVSTSRASASAAVQVGVSATVETWADFGPITTSFGN